MMKQFIDVTIKPVMVLGGLATAWNHHRLVPALLRIPPWAGTPKNEPRFDVTMAVASEAVRPGRPTPTQETWPGYYFFFAFSFSIPSRILAHLCPIFVTTFSI
jgi:hypothetical protein